MGRKISCLPKPQFLFALNLILSLSEEKFGNKNSQIIRDNKKCGVNFNSQFWNFGKAVNYAEDFSATSWPTF